MVFEFVFIGLEVVALLVLAFSSSKKVLNLVTVLNFLICLAGSFYLTFNFVPSLLGGYFVLDALSVFQILVTSIVFFLAAIYARGYLEGLVKIGEISAGGLKLFYIVFNLLFVSTILAFVSNNLFLFWGVAEITTLLASILISTISSKDNIFASLKYIFVASTSMLFSLAGLILLFAGITAFNPHANATFNWTDLLSSVSAVPTSILAMAFVMIFVGFASKAGIVPFHGWLPSAHSKAPSVVSVLLSGTAINVGIYGIFRLYAIANQTELFGVVGWFLIAIGLLTIAIAVFSMLNRNNLKKLVAFSSIEHMGILLFAMGIGTPLALFWMLFHILGHSLTKALLFFSSGIVHLQFHSTRKSDVKNIISLQPLASVGLIVGSMAIIGLPLFPIFLSKFFILAEAARYSGWLLFFVLLLLLVGAAGFAVFFVDLFSRTGSEHLPQFKAGSSMVIPIVLLLVLLVMLGVYLPNGLVDLFNNILVQLKL